MASILVVDDDAGMRQIISKILIPHGFEIISCDEGALAIEITKEKHPDAVLLDIRLSDMDSADILAGIKKIKSSIPVIILSGFGDIDAAVGLVRLGAFDYISKPFKVNDLLNLVNKALNQFAKTEILPIITEKEVSVEVGDDEPHDIPSLDVHRPSKLKKYAAGVAGGLVFLAGLGFGIYAFSGSIAPGDAEFDVGYTNPSSICWDGKNIWVVDWIEGKLYRHDRKDDFAVTAEFDLPGIEPTGFAFDGAEFWASNSFEQKIHKLKIERGRGFTVAESYKSPGMSPSGLCFDGKNMWSLDFQQAKVYKHKSDGSASVEVAYDSPAVNPCGMFKYKKHFFIADAKSNRIYKLSPDTFILAGIYALPSFEDGKKHIVGIACDGKNIWLTSSGEAKIYRFSFKSLEKAKI